MRDNNLCTLLITFEDPTLPEREITTAHTFSSKDPKHYPQNRRVVHSQHREILQITDGKPKVAANIKRVSKSSRSLSEGRLGSDMVEEIDRINFGQGRNIAMPTMAIHPFARNEGLIIQDVSLSYSRDDEDSDGIITTEKTTTFPSTAAADSVFLQYKKKNPNNQKSFSLKPSGDQTQMDYGGICDYYQFLDEPQPHHLVSGGIGISLSAGLSDDTPKYSSGGNQLRTGGARSQQNFSQIPIQSETELKTYQHRQQQKAFLAKPQQQQKSLREKRRPSIPEISSPAEMPISHRQTRSTEESILRESYTERKDKKRTVFERFIREELLTSSKSTTTTAKNTGARPQQDAKTFQSESAAKERKGLTRYNGYPGTYYQPTENRTATARYDESQQRIPSPPRPPGRPPSPPKTARETPLDKPVRNREYYSTERYELVTNKKWSEKGGMSPNSATKVVAFPVKTMTTTGDGHEVSPPPFTTISQQSEERNIIKPRIIDFETYKMEVEQLQRKALQPVISPTFDVPDEPLIPLSPAIVMPMPSEAKSPPMEPISSPKSKEEFVMRKKVPPTRYGGFEPEHLHSMIQIATPLQVQTELLSLPQEAQPVQPSQLAEVLEISQQKTRESHFDNYYRTWPTVEERLLIKYPELEHNKFVPQHLESEPTFDPKQQIATSRPAVRRVEERFTEFVESFEVIYPREGVEPTIRSEKPRKAPFSVSPAVEAVVSKMPPIMEAEIIQEPFLPDQQKKIEIKKLPETDSERQLLEMLRRDLQYEEELDYEVKRKKRLGEQPNGSGREPSPETSDEGSVVIYESADSGQMVAEQQQQRKESISSPESEERNEFEEVEERIRNEQILSKTSKQLPPKLPARQLTTIVEEEPHRGSTLGERTAKVERRRELSESRLPTKSISQFYHRRRTASDLSRPAIDRLPTSMVTETSSSGSLSPYPPSSTMASTIREAREREKKEMSELNDRLAAYIEKVRFLEAQNRKLGADLEFLRNRWGRDTVNVRELYEADIRQAKKLIEDTNRQKVELMDKIKALEEEISSLRRRYEETYKAHILEKDVIDELLIKLASIEAEVNVLKRRISILEESVAALRRENQYLMEKLQQARNDLDHETLRRIDYQNQAQALIEEIDFIRRANDQEIQDLQSAAARDTTHENREYFRNELSEAIREIRTEYDQISNAQRTDIESWYKLKVQEIQTQSARQNMEQSYQKEEVKRLRVQMGDLRGRLSELESRNSLLERQAEELNYQIEDDQRANESALTERENQIKKIREECQTLMVELQVLLDTKQSLDTEITIYRKMLEGEEDRVGLRQLVEQVVRTRRQKEAAESETMKVLRGESSSRQSYQRSAKGNVSVKEASPDGKFIILENTHRAREENISEWKLKRKVDGKLDLVFTFPKNFILKPGKIVTIWAKNQGIYSPPDQLIFNDEESFGIGHNVQTILYNRENEERASLIQRSSIPPTAPSTAGVSHPTAGV